ncbi:Uncharacterised protein [Pandoraea pulmonicola]|uniref:Uncharacterized protein n=1 Tax=Pandoraea pulmonicola TaxID=93221 RepID=A0AAJ5CZF3_PANPU|nr:Uncharacterised protein [Pandoraea pulmonicola]
MHGGVRAGGARRKPVGGRGGLRDVDGDGGASRAGARGAARPAAAATQWAQAGADRARPALFHRMCGGAGAGRERRRAGRRGNARIDAFARGRPASRECPDDDGRPSADAALCRLFADAPGRRARSRAQGSRSRSGGGGHSRRVPGGWAARARAGGAHVARRDANGLRIARLSRAARCAAATGRSGGARLPRLSLRRSTRWLAFRS